MANFKEVESKSISSIKLIASTVLLGICVSVITSFIVVKVTVPISLAAYSLPLVTPIPTNLQSPEIETNIMQNSGFEDGLSGWMYSDQLEIGPIPGTGITVFETVGVHGKAYCSRRFVSGTQTILIDKEWMAFVQEVPYDPLQSYLFSARIKLHQVVAVYAYAKFYYGSKEVYRMFINTSPKETQGTSDDWLYMQAPIRNLVPGSTTADRVLIGFWHTPIQSDTFAVESTVDSTFCVDDIIMEKIVK